MLNKIELNIFSLAIAFILASLIIIVIFLLNTNTLECHSPEGNLTIYYKKDKMRHYEIDKTLNFDIEKMNQEIDQKGIKTYVKELAKWYEENKKEGVCTFK